MGLREQSIVGCSPEFVDQLSVGQVLAWLRNQFIKKYIFPTWARAAGFNNYNYI